MASSLQNFADTFLPQVESSMRAVLQPRLAEGTHYDMMRYHLGWVDEEFRPMQANTGKGVRPLLCLLTCAAVGGNPNLALPAAAAVELLHNFSLVHDDVQDNSPTRRHRPTVWTLWGAAQAINVGDALFALSFQELLNLAPLISPSVFTNIQQIYIDTCLAITEGQHLDMDFERRLDVTVDAYLTMIRGKTATLLATCAEIGARLGNADEPRAAHLRQFGESLGLAFQIQDDILGIWGDESVTGKSAASDLLSRKKSLPVLFGFASAQGDALRKFYEAPVTQAEIPAVLELLERAGARAYAAKLVEQHSQRALNELHRAALVGPAGNDLQELALQLLAREA